jgi:hypothetical protein
MASRNVSTKPVATARLDTGSSNVTSAAYVQLVAATSQPFSNVEIFNPSGATLLIATGGAGSEVLIPYSILPGGSSILLPLNIAKGTRIALKAADTTSATAGLFVLNMFE